MEWIAGARLIWRARLSRRSGLTRLSTAFTSRSRATNNGRVMGWAAAVEVVGRVVVEAAGLEVGVVGQVEAAVEAAQAVGSVAPRSRARMARRFWSGSLRKRAGDSLRSRRNKRSVKFTTASSRSCARNTAWDIRPIKTVPRPVIITLY